MNFTMISTEELSAIREQLSAIKDAISSNKEKSIEDEYIPSTSIPKLLGISQKTWQTYRDNGEIKFIQIFSKIWVKRTDLTEFMDKHYVTRKKQ